jgi:hypothetical protein
MNNCTCPICQSKDPNKLGFDLAEKEVIPFLKKDVLKLKYLDHPFPMKYKGLLASAFAYSQALAYNRAHNVTGVYYTSNQWLLKYSAELNTKFGMMVLHESEVPNNHYTVCEFNTQG